MDSKKISFGFSKLTKKTNILAPPPVNEKKIDFIDCLEGHSIKIKNAIDKIVEPLIIPLNDNSKKLLDRIKQAKKANKIEQPVGIIDNRPDSELTIEELAARELLREATNTDTDNIIKNTLILSTNTDKFIAEGKEEPTLHDYENIPISEYGLAMLRGMGWSEDKGIGKNEKKVSVLEPELRPKGMGLGASNLIKTPKSVVTDKDGKELMLVKGVCAKIIGGQHKGIYCEVQGLDEESGRVIVKTAIKGLILTINEFLLTPVTKDEYLSSKVINNIKYEKCKENSNGSLKTEPVRKNELLEDEYKHSNRSRSSSREGKMEISKNKRHKSGKHKQTSSPSSSSHKRKQKKKKSKHKRSYSSSDSDYEERSRSKHNKHKTEPKIEKLRSSSESEEFRNKSAKTHYKSNYQENKQKHSSHYERKREKSKKKVNKSSSSESEYEKSNKYKR